MQHGVIVPIYFQFMRFSKMCYCRLQNALPFYILHQDKTNSLYHWQKILFFVVKIMAKRRGRPKLLLLWFLCHLQLSGHEVSERSTDLLPPKLFAINKAKESSSLIMFSWIAWPGAMEFPAAELPKDESVLRRWLRITMVQPSTPQD